MGQTEEIIVLCNWPTFYLRQGLQAALFLGSWVVHPRMHALAEELRLQLQQAEPLEG